MKPPKAPDLESRRAEDFERELLTRAASWIPSWSLDEREADFGLALLKIAARFHSEVSERLDKAGGKMALGFLDWLAIPAQAARPARVPVVFKMADTAREPVLAPRPVKLQAQVPDGTVTFETVSDLRIIPGQLAAVVGVDPEADSYYLPPPGLTALDPLEPLPKAWKLKNFAASGSKTLQLDPGIGLVKDMLVEIAGEQYRIEEAKDDLVKIDPEVPAGDGFAGGSRVSKVETFRPFDSARNLQEHILYIGDSDVLNVEAEARIEVRGLGPLPDGVQWAYWGKSDPEDPVDADARWRELAQESVDGRLILTKGKGSVEETEVGVAKSRWIRARMIESALPIESDAIQLKVNPSDLPTPPAQLNDQPAVDIFVNATPSTAGNVYLFGQEPRLFDTLYVGCEEAFSKAGATATIDFKLSDGAFDAVATLDALMLGKVLAAVDQAGALHLYSIGQSGQLTQFAGREPMRPSASGEAGEGTGITLTSTNLRPAMWLGGLTLYVAVAADSDVWVWSEVPPFIGGVTGWISLGTVPSDKSTAPIEGLASVVDGSKILVVALRNGILFKRTIDPSSSWEAMPTTIPDTKTPVKITSMRSKILFALPDKFLVVAKNSTNANGAVYSVVTNGTATEAFNEAATDVLPFGLWAGPTQFEIVGVRRNPSRIAARRSGSSTSQVNLVGLEISNTMIDGVAGGASSASYCVGKQNGDDILVTWLPFDTELNNVLFSTRLGGLSGEPSGPVSVLGDRAFLPGDSRGKILSAVISGPVPRIATASAFRSAIAFDLPPPTLSPGDIITLEISSNLKQAAISAASVAGIGEFSGHAIFWLDRWFDVNTTARSVQRFFNTSPSAGTGEVRPPVNPGQSILRISGSLALDTTHLLIGTSPAPSTSFDAVEVVSGPDANNDVTVSPELSAAPGTIDLDYWESPTIDGQVVPSLELGASNNDFDGSAASRGDFGFAQLDPVRQQVVAISDDPAPPNRPQRIAFGAHWISGVPPALPIRFFVGPVAGWTLGRSTPTTNPALAWEYWNGSGWWHLPVDDGTDRLRESGLAKFEIPDDLKPIDWSGKTNWWVRVRLIRGDYGEATVEVITDGTKQKVVRSIANIHAPYALNISVSYALDESARPAFLLTKDSGALRDQSDANRTPGAQVEIFTPLAVTLGRYDAPAASASSDPACVADCACDKGSPSMSPALPQAASQPAATASASAAGRRAIYLGFTSKLLGQPVNVLFNVGQEADYDAIGPLRADALIGDRFTPIVSEDETRALGETGLLKMSFDVAPLKADLFGQPLSWLRLTPSAASSDWKPAIGGVYPNGVWARSAETMTRELLGSSDGRPAMVVNLARPPLLRNSLELRIREPLGDEEVEQLQKKDADLVKSDVTDLPGHWVLWRQVLDPADCGPKDRVYSLDEATGTVRFGDGLHGMIPPIGVDAIVAFAYERTEPLLGGKVAANLVEPRNELNLVTPVETVETVIAADKSAGGTAPETGDRVLEFAPAILRHRDRAVSLRDFEELVRQKSEEVVQARAFQRNGRVRLVVVTKGANVSPSRAQQREWRRTLLEIAAPSLGVPNGLIIQGPRVRQLGILLTLRVRDLDSGGKVAEQAKQRLVARFSPAGGWQLGRTVGEEDIAEALLDIANLDGIVSIGLFEIDELGTERPFSRSVAPDGLVTLAPENVRVGFDVMEAAA